MHLYPHCIKDAMEDGKILVTVCYASQKKMGQLGRNNIARDISHLV